MAGTTEASRIDPMIEAEAMAGAIMSVLEQMQKDGQSNPDLEMSYPLTSRYLGASFQDKDTRLGQVVGKDFDTPDGIMMEAILVKKMLGENSEALNTLIDKLSSHNVFPTTVNGLYYHVEVARREIVGTRKPFLKTTDIRHYISNQPSKPQE
jgi:hypothetical protein